MDNRRPAVPGPDPDRPVMMIRLRFGHERPEIWGRLFEELKRYRACCDEVWFSTGIGFPELDRHRAMSALMAAHAEELRSVGIVPSLQVQTTIGHSDGLIESAGAEGKTWGSYVGVHGEECRYVNCPRQPGFLAYQEEMARIYASWRPGSVWLDDDLRLSNHSPARDLCGCYCPYCLGLFAEKEGRLYSREELAAACAADPALAARWQAFGIESLCLIAGIWARTVHALSPETRFGMQHDHRLSRLPVFETLKKESGRRAGSRPGGGAYSDHYPYGIIDKAFLLSMQMAEQPGYETLGQICPEIESCPRTFCAKTSQGHRIESLLYLAMGMDSLSCFIMDPLYETPEWYGRELLAPLAAEAPSYREFIRHNRGCLPGGFARTGHAAGRDSVPPFGLPLIGVPQAGYSPRNCGVMLTEKAIGTLSEDELRALFRANVILDGAAARALHERGLGELICGVTVRNVPERVFDFYTDDELSRGLDAPCHYPLSETRFAFDVPAGVPRRVLTEYRDRQGKAVGAATVLIEGPEGNRIALIGNDGFNTTYASSSRVRFLNRLADYVSGRKLPCLALEPVQCLLVPMITAEGTLRSVTILNVTIGGGKPFELLLRGVPEHITQAQWCVPFEAPVALPLTKTPEGVKVTIPAVAPWGIGWLKV